MRIRNRYIRLFAAMLLFSCVFLSDPGYAQKTAQFKGKTGGLKRTTGTSSGIGYGGLYKLLFSSIGHEYGGSLGSANYMGELGGTKKNGRPLFIDYEIAKTRPLLSVFYRDNFNSHFAGRLELTYARISGDDHLVKVSTPEEGGGFYRAYRNLSFRSSIVELAALMEYNLMRYEFGKKRYRYSPYVCGGLAFFYHNPQANYNGTWVNLQPLGTEGQGVAAYPDRKPYARVQFAIPMGIGFKYNINRDLSVSFEYGHRFTFTDYLDDVSKTYVDPAVIYDHYSDKPLLAQQIVELANRSGERTDLDPGGEYAYITKPGQQRGDPRNFDQYFFTGVLKVSYIFKRGRMHTPKF